MAGGHTIWRNGNVGGPVKLKREPSLHDGLRETTPIAQAGLVRSMLTLRLPDLKPEKRARNPSRVHDGSGQTVKRGMCEAGSEERTYQREHITLEEPAAGAAIAGSHQSDISRWESI